MDDMLNWIFRLGVVGIAIWAIKGYINEKAKRVITLSELDVRCTKCREQIAKERDTEMSHVKELIEKDLEHGRKRFDDIERAQEAAKQAQEKTMQAIVELSMQIKALQKVMQAL